MNIHTAIRTTSVALAAAVVATSAFAQTMSANRSYLAQQYFLTQRGEQQDWDIQDSNYLQGRAVNAINGGDIYPRDWRKVPVVSANPVELESARVKLTYAMQSGAVNQHAKDFSRALVAYDCWVGQQKAEMNASHNLQPCRATYYRYAAVLPNPPTTKQVVVDKQVPTALQALHKVYFGWDVSTLSMDAQTKLDEAKARLTDTRNGRLVISGHADASGPNDYNMALSRKRAQNVANYLGLNPSEYEIAVNAFGENDLPVPTADGVREPENRVVTIGIRATKDVTVQETKTVPVTY